MTCSTSRSRSSSGSRSRSSSSSSGGRRGDVDFRVSSAMRIWYFYQGKKPLEPEIAPFPPVPSRTALTAPPAHSTRERLRAGTNPLPTPSNKVQLFYKRLTTPVMAEWCCRLASCNPPTGACAPPDPRPAPRPPPAPKPYLPVPPYCP
ncbi:hypothetical protein Vafri_4382, partial [Volvox africanus]